VIPHDDEVDLSLAADEDADLPVGLSGNLAEGPGKLEGENPVNRDFAAVELLDASDLAGLETGNVAIDTIDAVNSSWRISGPRIEERKESSGFFRILVPRTSRLVPT
jgi:hypothetical protein